MLVPLTRQKFEQLIPLIATASQYKYAWGNLSDFLIRLLISFVSVLILYLIRLVVGDNFVPFIILIAIFSGLYWLWGPVFWASLRNFECRRYKYSGFWRGEVIDLYVTEEIIGKEQTVNKRGELVIVENRERRLNLEVGDETGFTTQLQVPLKRAHQAIAPGEIAEMLVMSNRADLSRIAKVSDIYLPELDLWVSDYPCLRHDEFVDISSRIGNDDDEEVQRQPTKKNRTGETSKSAYSRSRKSSKRRTENY
ncbi:MAG TPA: phosphate ABC transporter permease [Leptolyngbyaceae cyanobacterium]